MCRTGIRRVAERAAAGSRAWVWEEGRVWAAAGDRAGASEENRALARDKLALAAGKERIRRDCMRP